MQLVVRGVHAARLHAGRPRLLARHVLRPRHAEPAVQRRRPPAQSGNCSTPVDRRAPATASKYIDIGGRDEVHGEASDDTVYTGCGDDVIYGDAQDDDLIGGWGNDWISGGTGQDGVLGDDGRIFTSRNSAAGVDEAGASCTGEYRRAKNNVFVLIEDCFAEPLYGVAALVNGDPDDDTSQGYVLNEFIYTPGHVQQATINVAGALQEGSRHHAVQPRAQHEGRRTSTSTRRCSTRTTRTTSIFGGWDDDFLHGASGDDAIGGAEALVDLVRAALQRRREPGRPDPHRLDAAVQPRATCSCSATTTTRGTRRSRSSRGSASSTSTTSTTRAARSCSTTTARSGAAPASRTAATPARDERRRRRSQTSTS